MNFMLTFPYTSGNLLIAYVNQLFPSSALQSDAVKYAHSRQTNNAPCCNFMHYVQKKNDSFCKHGSQEYRRIPMKIMDGILPRFCLIFPENLPPCPETGHIDTFFVPVTYTWPNDTWPGYSEDVCAHGLVKFQFLKHCHVILSCTPKKVNRSRHLKVTAWTGQTRVPTQCQTCNFLTFPDCVWHYSLTHLRCKY